MNKKNTPFLSILRIFLIELFRWIYITAPYHFFPVNEKGRLCITLDYVMGHKKGLNFVRSECVH